MKYKIINNKLFCLTALLVYSSAIQAATPVYDLEQLQHYRFSYQISPYTQSSSDLDGGGSYSVSSLLVRMSVMKPVSTRTFMGLGISYDLSDYDFENLSAFGGQQPWDKVRSLNFNLPVIMRTDSEWTFMVSPSIGSFQEVDADWKDSLAYGATFIGSYSFGNSNRIGIGLGAFDRLDETILFPFLSVKWQLTENLRIGNALNAGPTGPAGLQLEYSLSDKWETAVGFARRSLRFRLDDSNISPGGVGTQKGRLLFVRLSTKFTRTLSLDLYAGAVFDGNLLVEDNNNNPVASADYGTAPLLSLNLNGRF